MTRHSEKGYQFQNVEHTVLGNLCSPLFAHRYTVDQQTGGGGTGNQRLHDSELEHIVCSNIMAHLDEHRLLSEKQHAFRQWHSCETQLITVIDDWAKILDNQGQVDTFKLDFEKAFDTPLMNFSKANCLAMELEEKL